MNDGILICTDLDRTLIPNGVQPESPGARERFAALASRSGVTLSYVTGRHQALVEEAIYCYALPMPQYVIADVGTTIYEITDGQWTTWDEWQAEIAPDWQGADHASLLDLFADLAGLRAQESEKQNTYKLSYYVSLHEDSQALTAVMRGRLSERGIHASLIWSVDETAGIGLLDVLPARATKLHAVEFLMRSKGFSAERSLFAGDSGNDLPVLASAVHSVLVANATEEVREAAKAQAEELGNTKALYLASGGFRGMNGNYSAGILEGLAHFMPDIGEYIPG